MEVFTGEATRDLPFKGPYRAVRPGCRVKGVWFGSLAVCTGQAGSDLPMKSAQPPQSAKWPHGTTRYVFSPWRV